MLQVLAQKQNYALVLLLFALLAYSAIGFSINIPAVQTQDQPAAPTTSPAAIRIEHPRQPSHTTPTLQSCSTLICD